MRIGIDGSCWANRRGFGRFTRGLISEMVERDHRNAYVMLVDSVSRADPAMPSVPDGLPIEEVTLEAAPAAAAGATTSRSMRDLLRMSRGARRLRCDVFFFPASYSYFPVVSAPVVVTVHDAIAERLPELTVPTFADRLRWRLKQRAALMEARAVLTVSDASRSAITEALRVRPERLHVIREAPDPIFRHQPSEARAGLLRRFGLSGTDRYVLYVGGISPHKNLGVLVDAFELVAAEDPCVRLLLVGDADDDPFLSAATSIRAAIERSPARERIQLTGRVSDEELVALYSGAVATALPSLGEGFGLTAAESAACGTPVVASRDPALVELLGDAGLYADARRPPELAAHFAALLADPAARTAASIAVSRRASDWSWAAAADATIALLEGVGRSGG